MIDCLIKIIVRIFCWKIKYFSGDWRVRGRKVIYLTDSEAIQLRGAADGVPGGAGDHPEHLLHLLRWLHTELVTTCQTSPDYGLSLSYNSSYPRLG